MLFIGNQSLKMFICGTRASAWTASFVKKSIPPTMKEKSISDALSLRITIEGFIGR